MLDESCRLKTEALQRTTDVQYELEGTNGKISSIGYRQSREQTHVDRVLRREGSLKAAIRRVRYQIRDKLHLNLHNY